ncbi:MAG: alkaline phosphatase family protein [Rhodocyclaceae bacterium]|nr:MAG: alkaline phosphatase family protein [Rhodocyclaceae bacterium]
MQPARLVVLHRFLPAAALLALSLILSLATRIALWLHAGADVPVSAAHLAQVFLVGLGFDLAAAGYLLVPMVLYLALMPDRLARSRVHRHVFRALFATAVYVLSLAALSEWVFWDEFGTRFNFIAVDYLVYTHEVLGNIWESYPVGKLLALLCVPAALATWSSRRLIDRGWSMPAPWAGRLAVAGAYLLVPLAVFAMVTSDQKDSSDNTQANELAGNGIYQFFAANRNNTLDYDKFYATLPREEAFERVRELLGASGGPLASPYRLTRHVHGSPAPNRLNIVLVSVESLGSEFIGALGNRDGITPELDRLTPDSLFFTQIYATGNRTVRGLEALSLSIPPTPGQSIVKRPKNEDLFSLGALLDDEGYDAKFVYGGYGYFDNMGYFFAHNDYEVVDRSALGRDEIHYENIWGVADEDLYALALRVADRSSAGGAPFFLHVMTTSNHRPYTYPEGRIDIPSGTGRNGAVKYTDHAIGKFLREARGKPWFDDTIFVITADHGASARGTTDIPVDRYRIPLWIYSPKHVAPGRVDSLASQIDIGPTVLGLLGVDHETKFFGRDILSAEPGTERAFLATYQTLGYLRDGWLVTLSPRREVRLRRVDASAPALDAAQEDALRRDAISYYQVASQVFRDGLYRDDDMPRLHHALRPRTASHG